MVLPPINIVARETFRQFADRLARSQTGGQLELNQDDPEADLKFGAFVDQSASRLEAETGKPKGNTFREIFDQAVGRAAGAAGRGALGAGRAVQEGFNTSIGPVIGDAAQAAGQAAGIIDTDSPEARLLDQYSAAGGSAVAQQFAPLLGAEQGIGGLTQLQYDPPAAPRAGA